MSGTHSPPSGLLQTVAWVTSLTPPSAAHTAYSKLRQAPLYCCYCSWQSSRGTWHLQNAGHLCHNWAALSPIGPPRFSLYCQASTSLHDPFIPGSSAATMAAPSPMVSVSWPFSAKPQLLSMAPSCLQNQNHLDDS